MYPGTSIPALEASIAAARDTIDQYSDLPVALMRELRDSGAFRLLTPKELGGHEAPLTTVFGVTRNSAESTRRSAGWCGTPVSASSPG